MLPRHAELIEEAGLRPAHCEVTGFAEACDGEPPLLTGRYLAAVRPAFFVLRWIDQVQCVAHLAAGPLELTEMEAERLRAEGDADGGVGQERVIAMVRDTPSRELPPPPDPEVLEAIEVTEEPDGTLTELTPEQQRALLEQADYGSGW